MSKHRIELSSNDIERALDGLEIFLTGDYWRAHPIKAKRYYDTYQNFGQALGEENIILEFESEKL